MHKCLTHQVREALNCLGLRWVSDQTIFLSFAVQHFTVGFLIGPHDPVEQAGKSLLPF